MIHYYGIRHHGPGSARSLLDALRTNPPDILLVEGPPEAEAVLSLLANPALKPPVALLLHAAPEGDAPPRAAFFPFAEFSPEWQALHYARQAGIPVRFIDLAQSLALADNFLPEPVTAPAEQAAQTVNADDAAGVEHEATEATEEDAADVAEVDPHESEESPVPDAIGLLAEAAGYSDGERFWEHLVEQQPRAGDVFAAIAEAMTAVRETLPPLGHGPRARRELCREASMRQGIRAAEKDGFQSIAVVCGAWHVPALQDLKSTRKDDAAMLKGLAKAKVQAAWVPWTHGRLLAASGYGAGIQAPGWYLHLWQHYQREDSTPASIAMSWLARVAQALRDDGLDASSAQLIDASRLIEALAALRGRELPDLDDLNEAIISVLHHGNALPTLLSRRLLVAETLGEVPDDAPALPLQLDFQRQCRSLRLKPDPVLKTVPLDLREDSGRTRSCFLHRLNLLGVPWGHCEGQRGRGTFREDWALQWQPELSLKLLEASVWGQTIAEAASNLLRQRARDEDNLPVLAGLIDDALRADLAEALPELIERVVALSVHSPALDALIAALEPLANAWRYGSVRQHDTATLAVVVQGFVTRICIGLPGACANLNEEAARARLPELQTVDRVLRRLDDSELLREWRLTLLRLVDLPSLHGLLAGWCCRLAVDHELLAEAEAAERFSRALSRGSDVERAAAWFEGFLSGQGLALIHDEALWHLVDDWLLSLPEAHFVQCLPLLRRTMASFALAERQQLASRAAGQGGAARQAATDLDSERAALVLPVLSLILGAKVPA